ncbi:MAG: hypothetical protein ABL982_08850 [Vicinamibacterales bacterium]
MLNTPPRGAIGFRLAHQLEGILTGIAADGIINTDETARLRAWLDENAQFVDISPFSGLVEHLQRALADGVLTYEESQDLLFVTRRFTTPNVHFDAIRGGLTALMGLLTGVSADRAINEHEVAALADWLARYSHLRGLWPYDECCAVVGEMLASEQLDSSAEHLRAMTALFPVAGNDHALQLPLTVEGICAAKPEIGFTNRMFVFAGTSAHAPQQELSALITMLGGRLQREVGELADYLVVCGASADYWAFSGYGRQVEKAAAMQRSGHPVTIVREDDFWEAVAAHGVQH